MGVMFLAFIIMGFVSLSNSKKYVGQAKSEKTLREEVTKWVKENEIGRMLDLSKDAVHKSIWRAKRMLKERLGND